nr:MAG TPA: hypothetical protein [Caudoviricetes sp.]
MFNLIYRHFSKIIYQVQSYIFILNIPNTWQIIFLF